MKIVTYKCDECGGQIHESEFLEIRSANEEEIMVMNNILPEGKDRFFKEAHFCSRECFGNYFFGESTVKIQTEESKVFEGPAEIKVDAVVINEVSEKADETIQEVEKPKGKGGWPKGKKRGPAVAENFRKKKVEPDPIKEEPKPEPVKVENRSIIKSVKPISKSTKQNDMFFQKLNFAKSLGYDSVSAALGEIDRYEFDKRFAKSEFAD